MTEITIIEVSDSDDMEACYAIRTEVFCREQQFSRALEFDGLDAQCRHYLARLDGEAIGTARVRPLNTGDDEDGGTVKFERVAVCKPFRGKQIGRALMDRALADARESGTRSGILHAQLAASAFYLKLGFIQDGGTFEEAGIPHVRMIKKL